MGSYQRLPSERARIARRFAVLVASVALLLPAPAVWLAPQAAASGSCPSGSTSVVGSSGTCEVTFDASGTWTIPDNVTSVDVVAVGGGGGGGSSQDPSSSLPGAGGGGGGGQVVQATYQAVTPGAGATITVGAGGAGGLSGVAGAPGGTSSFAAGGVSVSAAGGSPGARGFWGAPYVGGTGYGGASGAGYAGGEPKLTVGGDPVTWQTYFGGGGGGSSAPGGDAGELSGGNGGPGTVPSAGLFAGSSTAYAGGGGGGHEGTTTTSGDGTAGGGDGNGSTTDAGVAATANTGGGGGGTGSFTNGTGGAGGSGLVIVRFLLPGGSWTQTISFTSLPSNAVYGGTYTPTASATSGLPVSFTSATSSICSISAGVVSFTGVGTCTIDANQAGNTTYDAAPQVQQTFSVDKSSQMVGWNGPPPSDAVVGGTWTATGFASSGLTVTFVVESTSSSVCSIGANNLVTFNGAGICAIDATQAGNADYLAATPVLQSFWVVAAGPADQTITFTSTAPTVATIGGASYTPTATGGASGNAVVFTIDASAISFCSIDDNDVVTFTAAGTCTIDANQAGDASYNPAAQVQQSFSVAAASPGSTPTGTGVAVTPAFTGGTSPVTVTFGTVTSAGTTSLTMGTTPPAPVPAGYLVGSETFFDLETTATYGGPITVCFSYAGIAPGPTNLLHYESGSWVDITSSVDTTSQVICGTPASLSPFALVAVLQSQTVSFSSNAPTDATVGGPNYTPTASASSDLDVVLTIDSGSNSVCSIDGSGVVSFTAAGTCTIDANQAGDANYAAASQAQQSFSVGKGTQTITFTTTAPSDAEAGGGTYTPTATGGASGNPVVFTIDASATAFCSISGGVISFTSAGTCVIDANQAGSTIYSAAPQVQQSFTVGTRSPGILYATPDGLTSGSCDSWENACQLRYPLSFAIPGDQIWAAAGTYMPTISTNRNATFQLKNGVALYGGFAGTETSLDQRNANPATNGTVLSGDIGTPGTTSDNVFHVVSGYGADSTAVLDGFTVTGGNANGGGGSSDGAGMYNNPGSPAVRNVIFSVNTASDAGGGMYDSASSPTLSDVTFRGNTAGNYGGGMDNEAGSSPTLTDVTFSGNLAVNREGGGMDNNNSSNPTLTNVTFSGNAGYGGAAMANFRSSPTLTNATFTGNSGAWGSIGYEYAANLTIRNSILWNNPSGFGYFYDPSGVSSTTITYSVVQGGYAGVGNTSADPLLGSLGSYGGATKTVPLLPGSPAIDAASSTFCPATDQRGVTRPQGSGCDMGAFEAQPFSLSVSGGDNQSARVNTAFGSPLQVTVTSPSGDPVVGGKVTFTAPESGAGATCSANPVTIGAGGTTSVTATANGTGGSYEVTASAAGASAPATFDLININPVPTFTFDLSTLPAKTYGDASFSVATYASKPADDTGAITFSLGAASTGCSMTSAGMVTLTGAAVDPAHCVINASLAADSAYLAAGPISQSFNIQQATLTVTPDLQALTYGDPVPTYVFGMTGWKNSDSSATVVGYTGPVCTSTYTRTTPVSSSPLTISCSGGSATNYTFDTTATAQLTIARAASTVTVTCTVGAPYTYTGSAQTPCAAQATGAGMIPVTVTSSLTYANNTNAGAATASASWAGDANHTGNTGSGGFTIAQASTSVLYTGGQVVAIPNPFTLSEQRSGPATCPISYALDTNPTTGDVGPYALVPGSGGAVSTTGWGEGVYVITVTLGDNTNCLGSTDQATLTVASPGDTASGGGWYTLSGSGRVNIGFTVKQVPKTSPVQYKGQFVLVNNGKWRLKGTLTSYVKTNSSGASAGTGSLYWWNQSLNGGLGDWTLAASNVAYTISFTGGTRKSTGSFGIHISYVPVAPQPGSLPNGAPTALKGGNITVN